MSKAAIEAQAMPADASQSHDRSNLPAILLVLPALALLVLLFIVPVVRLLATSFEGAGLPYFVRALGSDGLYMTIPFILFAASYFAGALCWLRVDVTEPIGEMAA